MEQDSRQSKQPDAIKKAVERLPQISPGALRILDLVADKNHTLQDVIQAVENDAALTAALLKVVNSAAYALAEQVSTVSRAVTYLGEKMVVSLVLEQSIGQQMQRPLSGYNSPRGELWQHDLRTAVAARAIAECNPERCVPDLAFTAGLLHDIGKTVLSEFVAGNQEAILGDIDNRRCRDFLTGEEERVRTNHAETGYELAVRWNLPTALQMAIRYHHTPANAPEEWRTLAYTVHLGDIVAMMSGHGTGIDTLQYRLDKDYVDYLSLNSENLVMVICQVEDEYRRVISAMNMS